METLEKESNKYPWSNLVIHIINNFDAKGNKIPWIFTIPFTGVPPTDKQNKDDLDLPIEQLLDPKVLGKHPEKFWNFCCYSWNSWYFYKDILKEIGNHKCDWMNEWAAYITNNPEKSWFYYRHYTTYGDLFDMDHDDPTNKSEVFQALFNQFLWEKNIKLLVDQKEITRDDLKKIYGLHKKMWL